MYICICILFIVQFCYNFVITLKEQKVPETNLNLPGKKAKHKPKSQEYKILGGVREENIYINIILN